MTVLKGGTTLAERGQLDHVGWGDGFERQSRFAPRGQAADDHVGVEAVLFEQQRHPGAGSLAQSSAVEINVLVFGKNLDFFGKIVWLKADRSLDAFGAGVVVAVAAHVGDHNVLIFRSHP